MFKRRRSLKLLLLILTTNAILFYLYRVLYIAPCSKWQQTVNRATSWVGLWNEYQQQQPSCSSRLSIDTFNGLGNRVQATVTAVFWAVLTGRQLDVVKWIPGDNHLTYFSDMFQPIPGTRQDAHLWTMPLLGLNSVRDRFINEMERYSLENTNAIRAPKEYSSFFEMALACGDKDFHRDIVRFPKTNTSTITTLTAYFVSYLHAFTSMFYRWLRTDQYLVALTKHNPALQRLTNRLFPNGQIFASIGRSIFHPRDDILTTVLNFVSTHCEFAPRFTDTFNIPVPSCPNHTETYTIAIHLRTRTDEFLDAGAPMDPFLACNRHILSLLPSHVPKITVFVASDDPDFASSFISQLSLDPILSFPTPSPPSTTTMSESRNGGDADSVGPEWNETRKVKFTMVPVTCSHETQKTQRCLQSAVAELVVLGLSDTLLKTSASTFSNVAEIWRDWAGQERHRNEYDGDFFQSTYKNSENDNTDKEKVEEEEVEKWIMRSWIMYINDDHRRRFQYHRHNISHLPGSSLYERALKKLEREERKWISETCVPALTSEPFYESPFHYESYCPKTPVSITLGERIFK